MAKVLLKHVSKVYDNGAVGVEDADFEVADGELMVLVGPSGCGKSTTLRLIAGLEEPTAGEIYIGERLVNEVAPKDRDIAMVFQNYALYPHMNSYDNMAFGLKLRKYSKVEIKERVEDAAEILGIEDLLDRKPRNLSGGQQQRVALGRAIVRKPKVFLFDEPLSNLDAKLRVQMRTEISKLHISLGATMVYVTHDQVEAMTMGERITAMKDGVIHQIDTPINLYDRPVDGFVAGFIGSPSMNFLTGGVVDDGGLWMDEGTQRIRLPDDDLEFLQDYVGKEVILGVRPEDISVAEEAEDAEADGRIEVTLEVVEPMGNETFLHLRTERHKLVARIGSSASYSPGSKLPIVLDTSRAHYFDAESGARIAGRKSEVDKSEAASDSDD